MVKIEKAGGIRIIHYFLHRIPTNRIHLHAVFRFGGRPPDAHGLPVPTPPEVLQFIKIGFGEVILFGEDEVSPQAVISLILKYDERAKGLDVFVELKQVLCPDDIAGMNPTRLDIRIAAHTSLVVKLEHLVGATGCQ